NLINERRRLGIKCLAEAASLHGKISENHIYFGLGPRLNAAGRLEHASKSVELLLAEDPKIAMGLAQELNRINSKRQDLGAVIKEEVFGLLDEEEIKQNKIILLSGQGWHPGVIGIVAQQLVDTYYRPTVLVGVNDGVGRGSARSIEGFNIFELLDTCRDLFLDFGGHEAAAGFEIEPQNISELKQRLENEVDQILDPEDLIAKVKIDLEIEPAQITLGLVKELERLAPYGEGNPEPVFMIKNLHLLDFKQVGNDGRHLKLWFKKDGINLEVIGFGMGGMIKYLNYQKDYDIACTLETNEYQGFERVQLNLVDMREAKR
ncbi:MAG: single-stranded-DNA-specific exonuclease RecJ, partial [Candidatus Margulisiibacteriota bacterium]